MIVYACIYTMCCMHCKIKECEPDGDVATDCNVFIAAVVYWMYLLMLQFFAYPCLMEVKPQKLCMN